MRLFIAEKPSVARAVVDVLPKPHKKENGFIRAGSGDIVTWCVGHLLENAEPEKYNPAYAKWRKEDLPIIPDVWQLVAKPGTRTQLEIIAGLIRKSDVIIHTGDPDRVGQILVDEVIQYAGISKEKRAAVKRCLINDLNPAAISKSLDNLRDNTDFIPLATSALARARADWLYGINMTRLCTLLGQHHGYKGVLSIGRVQTPVLGLVAYRDHEIENFVSKPFYEVTAEITTESNENFTAKWKPSEACEPYMDDEGRVLLRRLAENVIARVTGKEGKITKAQTNKKQEVPPLLFNLSALQIEAAKRFNLSAKEVLDGCQSLYEKHKLLTYPRSDCRYLPAEHFNEAKWVTEAISQNSSVLQESTKECNFQRKTKVWNDKEVGAHHAIIPTRKSAAHLKLTKTEANLYELVARQYLMQFFPDFTYAERILEVDIEGGMFRARQEERIAVGWKTLLLKSDRVTKEEAPMATVRFPELKKGDSVHCQEAKLIEKETTPARHFTDATLLSAMTGIARFVTDPQIKKVLRATDGLGTEATRAGIIELLFTRNYLTRVGRTIRVTEVGKSLIFSLPDVMTKPDMTAHWESQLEAISLKQTSYQKFIESLILNLHTFIDEVSHRRLVIGK